MIASSLSRRVLQLALTLCLTACAGPAAPPTTPAPPTVVPPPTAVAPTAAPPAPTAPPIRPVSYGAGPALGVDAAAIAKSLGRGVNFGNALEAPTEGEWGMKLEEGFFELVKQGGFQTVRLPTRWSAHALDRAPYTIDETFFERVDWAIDNATKRGLNIVINMHHYEELMTAPDANRARFVALWKQIAARYKERPASVVFEPHNEPNGITSAVWEDLFAEALAVIRQTNPDRAVIVGGVDWNSIKGLEELKLPADKHLIATFHYYAPFQFTHQGAEWVNGSADWVGTIWKGNGTDKANIDFDLDKARDWGKANDRPVWLGEFGSYGKSADMKSREKWTTYLAREAERRGISWAYWEFGAGFGVYDRASKTWVAPIKKALVPG